MNPQPDTAPHTAAHKPADLHTYEMPYTVTYGEINVVGIAYYADLFRWLGKCRELWGFEYFPRYMYTLGPDLSLLTSTASCEFLGEMRVNDHLVIGLTVPWVRLHLVHIKFTIHRLTPQGKDLTARAEQTWANCRRVDSDFVPDPWPQEVLDGLTRMGTDLTRATTQ
ncbi:acyl-CoA thioesterase [Streptomyces sp. NPDC048650]|uniref:acyl-CoA thioesterase n=1 Tax=unclassified Streptomyces TaxID=2593676 RepID=UPI00371CA337